MVSNVFASVGSLAVEAGAASDPSRGLPLLTLLVAVPAVMAVVVALIPRTRPEIVIPVGFAGTLMTGALAIAVLANFKSGEAGYQFASQHEWIKSFGISWNVGVDGLSILLVALTGVLFPIALIGPNEHHDLKSYTAWILLLEAGVMGVFISLDLFLFFMFFEIVLVPMYFLIGGWGHGERQRSAMKFFLYTMFGSALLLVATLVLVFLHRADTGILTFDVNVLAKWDGLATNTGRWLFAAFALAFAIKVPVAPLHTWLPDAHTDAPTAGSVILAGVLLKMGTYGLLRFGLYLFPGPARWFAPTFLVLGVIGIIYGALTAVVQKDLKRLVAYSSVAHLGFIVLGTFAMSQASVAGGVLQGINHGISTPALFLLIGWIYERRHTREISALKGLQGAAPVFAGVFTIVMLSSIGVPGLNGFAGEFLILAGTFVNYPWYAIVGAFGVILAALYLLWAYQRVFHGTPDSPDDDNAKMLDLTVKERLVIAPLLVLIVFLGVYPKPALDRIEPSVKALITHVEERTAPKNPDGTRQPREERADIPAPKVYEKKAKAEHGGSDSEEEGKTAGSSEGDSEGETSESESTASETEEGQS
jgi:NADH-quinone oxidoreductase subunit M